MSEDEPPEDESAVVQFPFSRVRIANDDTVLDLGLTPLSKQVGPTGKSPMGHWCGRCRGIWYSYFLEAECPICGNRHG